MGLMLCLIYPNLAIKTLGRCQLCRSGAFDFKLSADFSLFSGVYIVDFKQVNTD